MQVLDLSNCNIPNIHKNTFAHTINLRKVNLNDNYLVSIDTDAINYLKKLKEIHFESNGWKCDNMYKELSTYLIKNEIKFENHCKKINKPFNNMFERMINLEDQTDEKNLWIPEEDERKINYTYINCTDSKPVQRDNLILQIIEISPILAIIIPFVVGIVFGLIIGCSVSVKPKKHKATKLRHARHNSIIRNYYGDSTKPLVCSLDSQYLSNTTPIFSRRLDLVPS